MRNRNGMSDGRGDLFLAFQQCFFDTLAIYLTFSQQHLKMERMGVRVTDEGFTVVDAAAPPMAVAMDWEDLDAYEEFLTQRLLAATVQDQA